MSIADLYDLLYSLGLTANYVGFSYLSYAVLLAAEDSSRLLAVTKRLYPQVAREYGISWKAVEKGIRSAVDRIWEIQTPALCRITYPSLMKKPTAACFIAMLSGLSASK